MSKNGTASDEYMHESIKKDAVQYDLPSEEIISALVADNEQLHKDNDLMGKEIEEQRGEIERLKQSCKAHAEYARQRLDRLKRAEDEIEAKYNQGFKDGLNEAAKIVRES